MQSFSLAAQCPDNIDFERGDFTGWQCWLGSHFLASDSLSDYVTFDMLPVPPVPDRHIMLSSFPPGDGRDPYGGFPRNCPNGSGHSVQLGRDTVSKLGRTLAQGISYKFTIPPDRKNFNLVYQYAVIIQNSGLHTEFQQACFMVEVKNLTDNQLLQCTSFGFHATSSIPGFYNSTEDSNVKCKNWAAANINLDGLQGKEIQIFFKTATCTPAGHWGYAYIDINSECSSAFTGATFCPDDTVVNVIAPSGYQNYHWYSINNPNLGNQQSVVLKPPPLSGDSIFVDLTPYNGYGCVGTLKAYLFDTLTIKADAGADRAGCYGTPTQLGGLPKAGLVYNWSPAEGLSNTSISNPIADPLVNTQYILTVTNSGGGCATKDTVNVSAEVLNDSIQLIGKLSTCLGNDPMPTLIVLPADSIQWFRNTVAIPGATQAVYNPLQPGFYYAVKYSNTGCTRKTPIETIDMYESSVPAFGVNTTAQCLAGNKFIFTNTTPPLSNGDIPDYVWDMGDGNTFNTKDVTYSYTTSGNYAVKLFASTWGLCPIEKDIQVNVLDVKSSFSVNNDTQCFKNNSFVFTNQTLPLALQYNWDMGDGTILHTKDVQHSYVQPGNYLVKLFSSDQASGCNDDTSFSVLVNPNPVMGFNINNSNQCLPNNQFVITNTSSVGAGLFRYAWDMGDGTIKNTTDVNYSYANVGGYTIKLLASSAFGCSDSLSKNVQVYSTPVADFTVRPVCENIEVPVINRTVNNTTATINYLWDFGNGHTDNVKSPVYSYPIAGLYTIKLSVSTGLCPAYFDTKALSFTVDKPVAGISYPDKDAAFNFPEPLQARNIGTTVTWSPATNLSNRFSYTPNFTGLTTQLYTISLKTATGCVTVDTQLVKTHKRIEIYVPNAFTPDGNGVNERLRPVLIGFTKVNYFNVYNRYGQLIFSMNSDQPGWDGKIGGKLVDTQTVVWMIEAVDVDGVVHTKKGTTVLYK